MSAHRHASYRLAVLLVVAGPALACAPAERPRPKNASSRHEIEQPNERAEDDDTGVLDPDPDPAPRPPEALEDPMRTTEPDVVEQAGVGGPVAYGDSGVLEVGGTGTIFVTRSTIVTRLSPFLGWFVFDGVQLAIVNDIFVSRLAGEIEAGFLGLVEVSFHVPLNKRLLFFLSAGPGALFNGADVGAAVRMRAGFDVLIGRSAVLHPGLFAQWSHIDLLSVDGRRLEENIAFGLELGYGGMF